MSAMPDGTSTVGAAGGAVTAAPAPPPRHPRRALRGDIEGLRAVAVLMVVAYHAGVPGAAGGFAGVDVFFVISGFLITGLLVRDLERHGTVRLGRFYARRARRLLPAAGLVLVTTGLAGWWLLPSTRWSELAADVAGSAVYVVNWTLAARSVDYLAEDSAVSPLQHYWSLAVEEQYYLVWPLLLLGVALVSGGRRRVAASVAIAAVLLASLLWSVRLTETSPAQAYFVTTTRVWELAVGALVALAAPLLVRLGRLPATLLAGTGLAMVLATLGAAGRDTAWPGTAAALPVLGAAAVVAAGVSHPRSPVGGVLDTAPMRWVGAHSYALYLWHWPVLVLAREVEPGLSPAAVAGLVLLSVLLAWLTRVLVEDPVRFGGHGLRTPAALGLCALSVAASLLVAAAVASAVPRSTGSGPAPGATVLGSGAPDPGDTRVFPRTGPVTPTPAEAVQDVPAYYEQGCQTDVTVATVNDSCVVGDPAGALTVAVVGDSKMGQWAPALDAIGRSRGWRVELYLKSACALSSAPQRLASGPYPTCTEWGAAVVERLTTPGTAPDAVLVSQGRSTAEPRSTVVAAEEELVVGMAEHWRSLVDAGIRVVPVADTPAAPTGSWPGGGPVRDCVANNPDDYWRCEFPRNVGLGTPALLAAADRVEGVEVVDLNDTVCPAPACRAVVGGVLVFRQGSHVSATYVQTMTDRLERALLDAGVERSPG